MSFKRLLIGAAAFALLAGCGALQKPFAHKGADHSNPLLLLADGGGVQVSAAPDMPEEIAAPLLAAAVKGLADANVPATIDPEMSGIFRLTGGVTIEANTGGGGETARFLWRLVSAGGDEIGAFDQTISGDAPGWLTGDAAIFEIIAADAGQRIAEILRGAASGSGAIGPPAAGGGPINPLLPSLYLVGVDGAPGDGNRSLARSLKLVVRRAGGQISESLDTATHLVMGSAEILDADAGTKLLVISWAVTGLDGIEIGKVSQSNRVPAGMIAGRWGGLAYAIARGAGEGIFDILERSRRAPARRRGLIIPLPAN